MSWSRAALIAATLCMSLALPAAAAPAVPAFEVRVEAPNGPDAEALRAAIAAELGVKPAEAGGGKATLLVRIDAGRKRAELEFRRAGAPTLKRTIELPPDEARAIDSIALLAFNLVRDEAEELLQELRGADEPTEEATPDVPADTTPAQASRAADPTPTTATTPERSAAARARPGATPAEPLAVQKPPQLALTPINLSLFHPVSLYPESQRREVWFELGLVYGRVGAVTGVAIDVGLSRVDHVMKGAQISAGLAMAREVRGVQVAPLLFSDERVEGAQVGVLDVASSLHGAQVGVGNLATDVSGLQLGVLNLASQTEGVQLGVANAASRMRGLQFGVVNAASHVRGLQFGVVNIADRMDGVPIGILSVASKTRFHPMVFGSTRFVANAGLKLVTGWVFNEVSVGVRPVHELPDREVVQGRVELVIGAHLPAGDWFFEPGIGYAFEAPMENSRDEERQQVASLRGVVGTRLSDVFSVFSGAAFRTVINAATGDTTFQGEGMLGLSFW